ncbi:tetratricopeptide repeat protein [Streptomyces xantholiticus]
MDEDPVVAAAKGHQIDLDSVQSLADFAQACKWLRAGRSYAALGRAARPRSLPAATLSDLLNARSTPTRHTVISFLIACGLDQDAAQRPWLAAMERVATTNQPCPAGAVRVRLARPRLLGVHAAIQVPGATKDMPAYVPRDFDADLNVALTAAAAKGGFILLLGGSSVGKTRALYEAIRAGLEEWWLLHPADPLAINALAEAPTPRTVLWLDEIQRYLNHPTGLSVDTLRQLINAGTVVVATLWPHEYTFRTVRPPAGQPDPYENERKILELADQPIKVSETFSLAERRRGETLAGTDQRIRIALDSPDAGFTQVLAAGPALIRRWEHADPYARAVLTAAVDATRLGMRHPLAPELLKAMAPAYCTGRERAVAPANWFEMALAYATELLHGAAAALAPAGGATMGKVAGFEVADYLLQHVGAQRRVQPVPAGAWEALLAHAHHRDDVERLAASAKDRLRLCYAVPLYRRVLEAGDSRAVNRGLAELAARQGRTEDIEEEMGRHPGNNPPIPEVLARLANPGGVEELRVAADSGDWRAADRLAELLATRQRKELGARAASGDLKAARLLTEHDLHDDIWIQHGYNCGCLRRRTYWRAWLLAEDGYVEDALAIARGHHRYGDDPVALWAWLLAEHGRVDTLVAHAEDERQVARLLLDHDHVEALRIRANSDGGSAYRQLRNAYINISGKRGRAPEHPGSSLGAWRLAELLADPGGVEDALAVLRTYADLPLPWVWTTWADRRLVEVLFDHGRVDELRFRIARSNATARRLADLLAQRGRVEEALTMLRGLADQNHAQATWLLVRLLVERGRTEEALAILRPLVELHESDRVSPDERWEWPTRRLAQLLAAEGHIGELRDLIEGFRASFHYAGNRRLAELLAEHGHPGELRAEIDAGNPFAAERVIEQLASQGKFHEADRMWRFGLTAEGLIAEHPQ